MAILKKCAKCKRLGGYAKTATSEVCARCELKEKVKRNEKGQFEPNK